MAVCMHETDAKFYKLAEPIKVLESWSSAAEVGSAILQILNGSRHGLPAATTGLGIVPIILKAAGVRSWRKFESQSSECVAQLDDATIQLIPSKRTGDNAAIHLSDQSIKTTTEPHELGNAILDLLVPPSDED